MPSDRAPGLLKLNWKPLNVSLLVSPLSPAAAGIPSMLISSVRRILSSSRRIVAHRDHSDGH